MFLIPVEPYWERKEKEYTGALYSSGSRCVCVCLYMLQNKMWFLEFEVRTGFRLGLEVQA